ncbi:MAG: hypothetical protein ACJ72U_05360 [Nitrososphaeraceae archaeon]
MQTQWILATLAAATTTIINELQAMRAFKKREVTSVRSPLRYFLHSTWHIPVT